MARKKPTKDQTAYLELEPRRCLASVGWDGPGWNSADLNYYIGPTSGAVDQGTFESVIADALDIYSEIAVINFTRISTAGMEKSLDFTFGPIDGPEGRLAEAYLPDDVSPPIVAGDVQFDSDEIWEIGNDLGDAAYDLMYVAVHEIGHALGLEHSLVMGAVMHPVVLPGHEFFTLHQDDSDSLLDLYASRIQPPEDPPIGDEPGGMGGEMNGSFNRGGFNDGSSSNFRGGTNDSASRDANQDPADRWRERFFEYFGRQKSSSTTAGVSAANSNNGLSINLGFFG